MKKLGYLGPVGTFSHMAAMNYSQNTYQLVPFCSIGSVLDAFLKGNIEEAIVPIENSIGDVVGVTLDYLICHFRNSRLKIIGELILPIKQTLVGAQSCEMENILKIVSHSQALDQCQKFFAKKKMETEEASSTARAAQIVSQNPCLAAITSPLAAKIYGLKILAKNIADNKNNKTRFLIFGKSEIAPANKSKTTIMFVLKNKPGALYNALREFRNTNLTRVSSRTSKTKLGEYFFWIDVEGHIKEKWLKNAVDRFIFHTEEKKVWIVGSYPTLT